MTEKNWRRFLRTFHRDDLPRHIARHEREAQRTNGPATAKSQAEHATIARYFRDELARREALAEEARKVIRLIQGQPSHTPLLEILQGALALRCDTALEAGLEQWVGAQAGHGPLPPLNVELMYIGGIVIPGQNETLRNLLWGDAKDAQQLSEEAANRMRHDALEKIAHVLAESGLLSAELTEEEKMKLRARARQAQQQEMREEDAAD
jgi:hypothetical protein